MRGPRSLLLLAGFAALVGGAVGVVRNDGWTVRVASLVLALGGALAWILWFRQSMLGAVDTTGEDVSDASRRPPEAPPDPSRGARPPS